MDGCLSDPNETIMELHVSWRHASAQPSEMALLDSDGESMHSVNSVGEALDRCDVCRAFGTAPHVPIAGTPAVSTRNDKLRVDLSFPGDLIAQRATDVFTTYSF